MSQKPLNFYALNKQALKRAVDAVASLNKHSVIAAPVPTPVAPDITTVIRDGRLVIVNVDCSGSMNWIIEKLRAKLGDVFGSKAYFILFSKHNPHQSGIPEVVDGLDISKLPSLGQGTKIDAGFARMQELLTRKVMEKVQEVVLCFISDGDDSEKYDLPARMDALKKLANVNGACHWTLFTVAVQDPTYQYITFPAEFSAKTLPTMYSNTPNQWMPLVLGLGSVEAVEPTLLELRHWILDVDHTQNKCPFDVDTVAFSGLKQAASAVLNKANNVNLFETEPERCVTELESAKTLAHQLRERAVVLYKDAEDTASTDRFLDDPFSDEPYPTNPVLGVTLPISRKDYSDTVEYIDLIIQRLNDQLTEAKVGKILSNMNAQELTLALVHGSDPSKMGRLAEKAITQLRKAPTQNEFTEGVRKYLKDVFDPASEIHSAALRQSLTAAKNNPRFAASITGVNGLISCVSFPGFVLEVVGGRPAGLNIDSMCVHVAIPQAREVVLVDSRVAIPQAREVVLVDSVDFFSAPGDKSGLILVPVVDAVGKHFSDEDRRGWFGHTDAAKGMASYFLTLQCGVQIEEIMATLPGLALVEIYKEGPSQFLDQVKVMMLQTLNMACGPGVTRMAGLLKYIGGLEDLSPESVSKCLTTESLMLDRWFKCPSLGKFALGLIALVMYGNQVTKSLPVTPTVEQLMHIRFAWTVEALGRSCPGMNVASRLQLRSSKTDAEVLAGIDKTAIIRASFTPNEAIRNFVRAVEKLKPVDFGLEVNGDGIMVVRPEDIVVPPLSFDLHGWTFPAICRFLYNLATDAGIPTADYQCLLEEYSADDRLRIMSCASSSSSSYERCRNVLTHREKPMDYWGIGKDIFMMRKSQLKNAARTEIKDAFVAHTLEAHRGVPTPITQAILGKFAEEHPDVKLELELTASGLCKTACNFHHCAHFLKRRGVASSPPSYADTTETTTAMLMHEHLAPIEAVPCMHKAVVKNKAAGSKVSSKRLAEEIISGDHVSGDDKTGTQATIVRNVSANAHGDEDWLAGNLARIEKSYEWNERHYRQFVEPALLAEFGVSVPV